MSHQRHQLIWGKGNLLIPKEHKNEDCIQDPWDMIN